ncbi:MAG: efflux RND transporter periplasmic adaptor subunit [Christiangramia sp.]
MYRLLTGILLCFFLISCSSKEDRIKPNYGSISEFVYSSVTVQPDSLYKVYAAVNGILDKQLVEEGNEVKKDDPILQIINSNPKLNSENAWLSYKLAEKNLAGNAAVLRGIKDEINTAKLKLINDSIYFKKQEKLWQEKIGSKATYDSKKLEYEMSLNNLKLLENKYNRTQNELNTQLKQAENNYKNSLITTSDYSITSKINGKVYALYKNQGEIVNTLEPLASIGSSSAFVIEMLVDEVDIVRLKKGQKVFVHLDAYEGKIFHATVNKIYPKKDEANQTFMVEARFDNPPVILFPGLSGEANILIGSRENVITIPKDYLINDSVVKTDNGFTPVETGLESMGIVEVISGISKDTWVYKPEP